MTSMSDLWDGYGNRGQDGAREAIFASFGVAGDRLDRRCGIAGTQRTLRLSC